MDELTRTNVVPVEATEIHANILSTIGGTPLVRLNRVTRGVQPAVLAKIEFFNPGGSVKDRIGPAIIAEAERTGQLKPGGTIVEATSGNTGVGLAIAAAIKGYKCIFVMPDKMSDEKIRLLRAFGARVVITPTAVEPEDPRSYYSVAHRLVAETPNAILANQYHNPINPEAHYRLTGPELWRQTGGRIDVFVAGMGTGGTISGVGRYLKEQNPAVKIVGVDPVGSILHDLFQTGQHVPAQGYKVEGIGEDFLPSTLDLTVIDETVQVNDKESFLMTRRLVREEGIFCGGSSGTAVAGALRYIQEHDLGPKATVVVVLPDSGSRYLSKVFNDDWMRENRFLESTWAEVRAADVLAAKAMPALYTAKPTDRQLDVITLMKEQNISQVPVVADGRLVGIVTEVELLNHMLTAGHTHEADETIEAIIRPQVTTIPADTSLEALLSVFSTHQVALVVEGEQPIGIITKIDLLDFLTGRVR
ncbi:MAG: cystathionine beta-synthase [Anaerolineae bacterium]|nr:cystathionine beta-synthase [Anaerolineae bacterium]